VAGGHSKRGQTDFTRFKLSIIKNLKILQIVLLLYLNISVKFACSSLVSLKVLIFTYFGFLCKNAFCSSWTYLQT